MIKYDHYIPFNIKLIDDRTVRKTAQTFSLESFNYYQAIINHFIDRKDPLIVPVFNFQRIFEDKYPEIYSYTYDMKRLGMLSSEEKQIISHYEYNQFSRTLECISTKHTKSYEYDSEHYQDLFQFMINISTQEYNYNDLHSGNVMKDEQDNYLLIDLEGFTNYNYDLKHSDNAWLVKDRNYEAA